MRERAGEARRASLTRPDAAAIWMGQRTEHTSFGLCKHKPRGPTRWIATTRVSDARRV